ncbi:MAG: Fpg/Nei family DNA glycosylase, partial [Actinobacteria bacterium]|nr:Fpg/Nei family DNA glycosylase [Actinomycetota bacterium]
IHPRTRVEDLGEADRARLSRTLRRVLKEAIAEEDYVEAKLHWLNHVRGEPDARCPRCRVPLARIAVAGRTTYICPSCQLAPVSGGR